MSTPDVPAESVTLLHFADVHLGVESYGRFNPETGLNTRLEDFTKSLNEVIDGALAADVDLAVFAGDAYKSRDPSQTQQKAFAGCLKRLTDAGVPVVMVVGNHDIPNSRGRANALEIYGVLGGAGVTILQKPEVERIPTRKGAVLVAGMPYLTRSRVLVSDEARGKSVEEVAHLIRDKYTTYIQELAQKAGEMPEHLAILIGHFTVEDARVTVQNFLMNPNEPKVALSNVALPQFDYVAMGHVHKMQDMSRGGQPPVVYPGSIDRLDFGEKGEDKYYVIATVAKRKAAIVREKLDTRGFLDLSIDAGDAEDPTQAIIDALSRHKIVDAVVKVVYSVSADRAALVRTDEIRRTLAPAHVVVALSRQRAESETMIRSRALTDALTPERALSTYIEHQPRLAPRLDDLLRAARPLFEALEHEEAVE